MVVTGLASNPLTPLIILEVFPVVTINEKKNSGFRPMQISIWYPADKSDKGQMKYEDCFFLKAHEMGEIELSAQIKKTLKKESSTSPHYRLPFPSQVNS